MVSVAEVDDAAIRTIAANAVFCGRDTDDSQMPLRHRATGGLDENSSGGNGSGLKSQCAVAIVAAATTTTATPPFSSSTSVDKHVHHRLRQPDDDADS